MGKPSAVSIDTCAWHSAMPLSQLQGKNSFHGTVVWLGVERGASWGGALFRPKCSDYQLPCLAQRSLRCLLPCGDVPERIRGQAPDAGSWFCPARPLPESGARRKTRRPEWPMISAGHAAVGAITLCGVLVPLPMLPCAGCGSSATGGKRDGVMFPVWVAGVRVRLPRWQHSCRLARQSQMQKARYAVFDEP